MRRKSFCLTCVGWMMCDVEALIAEVRGHLSIANCIGLDESVARQYRKDVPRLIAALEGLVSAPKKDEMIEARKKVEQVLVDTVITDPALKSAQVIMVLTDSGFMDGRVSAPTNDGEAEKIMAVLNSAGAYCGECDYDSGYDGDDGCSQCRVCLAGYARDLIAAGFGSRLPVVPVSGDGAMGADDPRFAAAVEAMSQTEKMHPRTTLDALLWSAMPHLFPAVPVPVYEYGVLFPEIRTEPSFVGVEGSARYFMGRPANLVDKYARDDDNRVLVCAPKRVWELVPVGVDDV